MSLPHSVSQWKQTTFCNGCHHRAHSGRLLRHVSPFWARVEYYFARKRFRHGSEWNKIMLLAELGLLQPKKLSELQTASSPIRGWGTMLFLMPSANSVLPPHGGAEMWWKLPELWHWLLCRCPPVFLLFYWYIIYCSLLTVFYLVVAVWVGPAVDCIISLRITKSIYVLNYLVSS